MKRYFSQEKFERFNKDFQPLFRSLKAFAGELDLRLRDDYANVYYRGNSLAKISFSKDQGYKIDIHEKFVFGEKEQNVFERVPAIFSCMKRNAAYCIFLLSADLIKIFFQKEFLTALCRNIRNINYSEELTCEQMLITDYLNHDRIFIVDRQVTEPALRGRRIDLLALQRVFADKNQFRFLLVEIKTGKNPELQCDVEAQLSGYRDHLKQEKVFEDWKASYQETYRQLKSIGIFEKPSDETIEIINDTHEMVFVFGYSGIARPCIEALTKKCPDLCIKQVKLELE